ncbi:MAG: hypothetical protein R3296_05565 [Oleiphilaceae bacterium]|nr:hypothetical protein [Oleiphilaceae bacterium]
MTSMIPLFRAFTAVLLCALLSGCGSIENLMYRNTGHIMQGLSKKHTTPYLLQQSDVAMSCAMAEATTPLMLSFGRVTDTPDQLGVIMQLSAAGCAEERALEARLAYHRHLHQRRPAEARDAQFAAREHLVRAAERYHQAWKHLNAHYGAVGEGDCPLGQFEQPLDEFIYLSGLLAGLQAMNAQVQSAVHGGIPGNIPGRAARGAECLQDDRWWGVPGAIQATVWSLLDNAPQGVDPFERLEAADRKGEEAGVRLSHVLHALAAENAGERERVRAVLRRHAEAIQEPAHPDWVMVDSTATARIKALSHLLWTQARGHRTPTGALGTFWDDPSPQQEEIPLEALM